MRIAIVEIGHWHAGQYVQGARQLGHEIVGVSDHDAATAARKAAELGCPAFGDVHELLATARPEFVFAHGRHCEMTALAAALVANGTPFVMEKPMGTDWRALAAVAATAERQGLFAGADLVLRGYKLFRELARLRERGEFGRLTSYTHRIIAGEPDRYRRWNVPWVLSRDLAGGGPIFNFGPHVLDIFLWLSGERARRVFCRSSRRLHGLEIEDYDTLIVETDGGALGTFDVGYTCPGSRYEQYVAVCTDRLTLATPSYDAGTMVFRDGREVDLAGPGLPPALNYVEETLRRVRAGEPPLASIGDMCRVLQIINAAAESASTGHPVELAP